ncbi:MAG: hypothetical protein HQ464_03170 [Planctomycetes bacterium]|nr:hypothetical protein [Planctomycetota bacterium]
MGFYSPFGGGADVGGKILGVRVNRGRCAAVRKVLVRRIPINAARTLQRAPDAKCSQQSVIAIDGYAR